jgi:hypothetical protein
VSDNTPAPIYPPSTLPTVYADGILNLSNTQQVVKMYLTRHDPSLGPEDDLPQQQQVFAQLLMPVAAFVQSVLFLEAAMNRLAKTNVVKQADIDESRAFFAKDF